MKRTILVLGGDGYYGWPLAMKLAAQHPDEKIIIADNGWRRNTVSRMGFRSLVPIAKPTARIATFKKLYGLSNISYEHIDVNSDQLEQLIVRELPYTICHLAQQASAPYSMMGADEALYTMNNNEGGNMRLLWAVRKHVPDAHIIKIGSFGEYAKGGLDIPEGYFLPEHNGQIATRLMPYPREADDIYHISKINDTNYAAMACRKWHLRITDVMQSTIFGLHTEEMNGCDDLLTRFDYDEIFGTVLNRFLAQVVSGHPLTVYGTGEQRTGLMSLTDSVSSLASLVNDIPESSTHRVINHVTETSYSINELAQTIVAIAKEEGYNATIKSVFDPRHERPEAKPVYGIHTPYIDNHITTTPFNTIISDTLRFIKKHEAMIDHDVFSPSINMTGNSKHGHHITKLSDKDDKSTDRYWQRFREQHFPFERINLNPGTFGTTSAAAKKARTDTQGKDAFPLGMYEEGRVKNDEIHALCNELWPTHAYELAVTHATSQAMNLLCLSMLRMFHKHRKGPYKVLTTMHEHKGGIGAFHHLPEYELYYIDDATLADPALLKKQIEKLQPCVAFISHVYHDSGNIAPITRFCDTVRESTPDCKIIVDAAQSLGLYDPPLSADADVIIASTHKWLYGPHGGGLMWMKHEFHQWLQGMHWNGNSITNRTHAEKLSLQGGQDFMLYAGIAEALKLYKKTGKDTILKRSKELAATFRKGLEGILEGAGIDHTFLSTDLDSPMISVAFTNYDPYPLYTQLNEKGMHAKCIKDHVIHDTTYHIIRFGMPYYETHDRIAASLDEIKECIDELAKAIEQTEVNEQ